MADDGERYSVTPVDIDADGPATANEAGRRLFNVELAREYGYHFAPTHRFDRRSAQEDARQTLTTSGRTAYERCLEVANGQLPQVDDLGSKLAYVVDATEDEAVRSAIHRWSSCLVDAGIEPTEWPDDMPGPTLFAEFGLEQAAEADAPDASPNEIAVAIADAECREDSGFSDAYYHAEVEAQVSALEANQAELENALQINTRAMSDIRAIIQDFTGE